MDVEIRLTGLGPTGVPLFRRASFAVKGGRFSWYVVAAMEEMATAVLPISESDADDVLLTVGLRRLVRLAEAGGLPPDGGQHQINLSVADDGDELTGALARKSCRYHYSDSPGGELFCSAAAPDDPAVVAQVGTRRLSPTSPSLCASCSIPGEPLVCSALQHVQVVEIGSFGGADRDVRRAHCSDGHDDLVEDGSSCRAGGHDCWRLSVASTSEAEQISSPLALPEALDFLDALWRLRFGTSLLGRTALSVAAGLAAPVSTRDEFKARVTDLAIVLDFRVQDSLLSEDSRGTRGSLSRVVAALRHAGSEAPDEAIRNLRAIVDVRNCLDHQGMHRQLHEHLEHLGGRMDRDDWPRLWRVVESSAIRAITEIRNVVRPTD